MSRIAAGSITAHEVSKADVTRQVHTATANPSQAVNTDIFSIESIASVTRLEEWAEPQLATVLL
jgi:hypothetical protein